MTISFPLKTVLSFVPSNNPKVLIPYTINQFLYPMITETVMHRISVSNTIVNGNQYRNTDSEIYDRGMKTSSTVYWFFQLVLVIVLLAGLIAINFQLSKKLWKPFNDIVHKLSLYRVDSNDDYQFIPTNIEEFKKFRKLH